MNEIIKFIISALLYSIETNIQNFINGFALGRIKSLKDNEHKNKSTLVGFYSICCPAVYGTCRAMTDRLLRISANHPPIDSVCFLKLCEMIFQSSFLLLLHTQLSLKAGAPDKLLVQKI
jgi:hypothetical protein